MLAWRIAVRYLFSKKSHGVVNIISTISVIGVAVATMAITIVLSVFNGFTQLAAEHLSILDPQIKITANAGKTIGRSDSLSAEIMRLPSVAAAMPVIEERGLLMFDNKQMPVVFKGVPEHYNTAMSIDSVVIDGLYLDDYQSIPVALLSAGVAINTGARPNMDHSVGLYVPRRVGRINPANPGAAFSGVDLLVSGVFQIGQPEYDSDHVIVNIAQARQLLQYTDESTAIEVMLDKGVDVNDGIRQIEAFLGSGYKLETRLQQQEETYRMIQIEKWVTFLMLAFILIIASFNIISTLSLLVIEKRNNMLTLRALGATRDMIRNIFIIQGWLISIIGGIAGIILGTLLSLGQEQWGWIKLAGDPAHMTITTYPVKVESLDLAIVFVLVVLVGLLTSQVTRLFKVNN